MALSQAHVVLLTLGPGEEEANSVHEYKQQSLLPLPPSLETE